MKAIAADASKPGAASGKVTRQNTANGGAPSVAAASSQSCAMVENVVTITRTTKGNVITICAMMIPVMVATRKRGANTSSSIKPSTTEGTSWGEVRKA